MSEDSSGPIESISEKESAFSSLEFDVLSEREGGLPSEEMGFNTVLCLLLGPCLLVRRLLLNDPEENPMRRAFDFFSE